MTTNSMTPIRQAAERLKAQTYYAPYEVRQLANQLRSTGEETSEALSDNLWAAETLVVKVATASHLGTDPKLLPDLIDEITERLPPISHELRADHEIELSAAETAIMRSGRESPQREAAADALLAVITAPGHNVVADDRLASAVSTLLICAPPEWHGADEAVEIGVYTLGGLFSPNARANALLHVLENTWSLPTSGWDRLTQEFSAAVLDIEGEKKGSGATYIGALETRLKAEAKDHLLATVTMPAMIDLETRASSDLLAPMAMGGSSEPSGNQLLYNLTRWYNKVGNPTLE